MKRIIRTIKDIFLVLRGRGAEVSMMSDEEMMEFDERINHIIENNVKV